APARQVLVMPPDLAPEAAAMMEPVSCCVHGLDLADITAGDPTVILGAGSIGLILLQLARHAGAAPVVVVEPVAAKRDLALTLGADAVVDPSGLSSGELRDRVNDATDGGPQIVIEASGHEAAARAALFLPRRGGTVLFFGVQQPDLELSLRPFDVYHNEVTIRGAFTNPLTDSRARQMLATGRVQVLSLISHRFSIQDIAAGLDAVRAGLAVKAMVLP
ncbi:MAG: zinc-binding dehydrogenase, partial [Armatimonadetes bacterium]|nr:zinc-binding dehydrogenase [Armatimonadota bacterium]